MWSGSWRPYRLCWSLRLGVRWRIALAKVSEEIIAMASCFWPFDGIQQSRQDAVLASVGASEIKRIGVNVRVVSVKNGHVPEIVQMLKGRSEVRFAEPDYLQTISAGS